MLYSNNMEWQEYQNKIRDFFRDLGYSAETNKQVVGVRSTHKVDVWVEFEGAGLLYKLLVECKLWNSKVTKEKVCTLKAIVDDVGANLGIIVSERGFQPAAHKMAGSSNILLRTYSELRSDAEEDLRNMQLQRIERDLKSYREKMRSFTITTEIGENHFSIKPVPGVDVEELITHMAGAAILETGIKDARMNSFPAMYGFQEDKKTFTFASNMAEFCEASSGAVVNLGKWVEQTEKRL